jgi:hypothetical protein
VRVETHAEKRRNRDRDGFHGPSIGAQTKFADRLMDLSPEWWNDYFHGLHVGQQQRTERPA